MTNRRKFLRNLLSVTVALGLSKKLFPNLIAFDDYFDDDEFIIRNGWVLLKSDLDSTNDY